MELRMTILTVLAHELLMYAGIDMAYTLKIVRATIYMTCTGRWFLPCCFQQAEAYQNSPIVCNAEGRCSIQVWVMLLRCRVFHCSVCVFLLTH